MKNRGFVADAFLERFCMPLGAFLGAFLVLTWTILGAIFGQNIE